MVVRISGCLLVSVLIGLLSGCGADSISSRPAQFVQGWRHISDSIDYSLSRQAVDKGNGEAMTRWAALSGIKPTLAYASSFDMARKMEAYVASVTDENSIVVMMIVGCGEGRNPLPVPEPGRADSEDLMRIRKKTTFHMMWLYKNAEEGVLHVVRANEGMKGKMMEMALSGAEKINDDIVSGIQSGFVAGNVGSSGVCRTIVSVWSKGNSAIVAIDGLWDCGVKWRQGEAGAAMSTVLCFVDEQLGSRRY